MIFDVFLQESWWDSIPVMKYSTDCEYDKHVTHHVQCNIVPAQGDKNAR